MVAAQQLRFLSTTKQHSESPRIQKTSVQSSPSTSYLKEEEIDATVIPQSEVSINLTERAAEQLRSVSLKQSNPKAALRLSVESGGCHGYQYRMEVAKEPAPDDYYLSHPSIEGANVVVDAISLPLVNGTTIDYATELIGSSFKILENPNAVGGGCGCGVSWELKL